MREDLPVAARALKLTIQPWEIQTADGFRRVLAALSKEPPDGLYVAGGSPLMVSNQERIVGFALKSRLPSMKSNQDFVEAGGLMYYGADLADSYRRVATYVDKILKGSRRNLSLFINLKTAKQIGLTIPPNVLGASRSGDSMKTSGWQWSVSSKTRGEGMNPRRNLHMSPSRAIQVSPAEPKCLDEQRQTWIS